ncbi:GntR family transcriptional regulator [Actinocrinis puniceicyclus]|uniref:GntR family transcriptional regulator n=1 Tax=Actinocrinis puniceicyclus TaxID=977794 RepID=A0A8J7WSX2_9ACTN|nr:GntR family transcriptional regulator [Actinocrinis puniceicyclus]MBS2966185.1 GntR family transcriptional regulator [Actinocrinis puniceicyclus]
MSARYLQIASELRLAVDRGEYPIGSLLPSEGELAARYGVARGTVRQAVALLEREGVVTHRQGARRTVVGAVPTQSFAEMQSFSMWAVSQGHVPSARVLHKEVRRVTGADVERLNAPLGEEVLDLRRVRLLDGVAVMVERTLYAGILAEHVLAMELTEGSITERLTESGFVYAHADHRIDAVSAGVVEAELLGVRRGSALLRQRRVTTSPSGVALEWSDDRYRADAVTITVRNSMSENTLARLSARGPGRARQVARPGPVGSSVGVF